MISEIAGELCKYCRRGIVVPYRVSSSETILLCNHSACDGWLDTTPEVCTVKSDNSKSPSISGWRSYSGRSTPSENFSRPPSQISSTDQEVALISNITDRRTSVKHSDNQHSQTINNPPLLSSSYISSGYICQPSPQKPSPQLTQWERLIPKEGIDNASPSDVDQFLESLTGSSYPSDKIIPSHSSAFTSQRSSLDNRATVSSLDSVKSEKLRKTDILDNKQVVASPASSVVSEDSGYNEDMPSAIAVSIPGDKSGVATTKTTNAMPSISLTKQYILKTHVTCSSSIAVSPNNDPSLTANKRDTSKNTLKLPFHPKLQLAELICVHEANLTELPLSEENIVSNRRKHGSSPGRPVKRKYNKSKDLLTKKNSQDPKRTTKFTSVLDAPLKITRNMSASSKKNDSPLNQVKEEVHPVNSPSVTSKAVRPSLAALLPPLPSPVVTSDNKHKVSGPRSRSKKPKFSHPLRQFSSDVYMDPWAYPSILLDQLEIEVVVTGVLPNNTKQQDEQQPLKKCDTQNIVPEGSNYSTKEVKVSSVRDIVESGEVKNVISMAEEQLGRNNLEKSKITNDAGKILIDRVTPYNRGVKYGNQQKSHSKNIKRVYPRVSSSRPAIATVAPLQHSLHDSHLVDSRYGNATNKIDPESNFSLNSKENSTNVSYLIPSKPVSDSSLSDPSSIVPSHSGVLSSVNSQFLKQSTNSNKIFMPSSNVQHSILPVHNNTSVKPVHTNNMITVADHNQLISYAPCILPPPNVPPYISSARDAVQIQPQTDSQSLPIPLIATNPPVQNFNAQPVFCKAGPHNQPNSIHFSRTTASMGSPEEDLGYLTPICVGQEKSVDMNEFESLKSNKSQTLFNNESIHEPCYMDVDNALNHEGRSSNSINCYSESYSADKCNVSFHRPAQTTSPVNQNTCHLNDISTQLPSSTQTAVHDDLFTSTRLLSNECVDINSVNLFDSKLSSNNSTCHSRLSCNDSSHFAIANEPPLINDSKPLFALSIPEHNEDSLSLPPTNKDSCTIDFNNLLTEDFGGVFSGGFFLKKGKTSSLKSSNSGKLSDGFQKEAKEFSQKESKFSQNNKVNNCQKNSSCNKGDENYSKKVFFSNLATTSSNISNSLAKSLNNLNKNHVKRSILNISASKKISCKSKRNVYVSLPIKNKINPRTSIISSVASEKVVSSLKKNCNKSIISPKTNSSELIKLHAIRNSCILEKSISAKKIETENSSNLSGVEGRDSEHLKELDYSSQNNVKDMQEKIESGSSSHVVQELNQLIELPNDEAAYEELIKYGYDIEKPQLSLPSGVKVSFVDADNRHLHAMRNRIVNKSNLPRKVPIKRRPKVQKEKVISAEDVLTEELAQQAVDDITSRRDEDVPAMVIISVKGKLFMYNNKTS